MTILSRICQLMNQSITVEVPKAGARNFLRLSMR